MDERRQELQSRPCKCVICAGCRGSGDMWMDISGKYRGPGPCDDLDNPETCMWCEGLGVTEMCDRCAELNEIDEQESLTGRQDGL